ncbi:hypothetical protein [Tissierella praeacuta]|uniref:hypothetical protein n=1 Tax=Tissierella praeacuta TaxID=43131 RepID=UPI00333E751E
MILHVEIESLDRPLDMHKENKIMDNELEEVSLNGYKELPLREDELEVKAYVATKDGKEKTGNTDQISIRTSTRFRDWDTFFSDLEKDGEVKLSDYHVEKKIFNYSGWENLQGDGFEISAYTTRNGPDELLIHIGFMDFVAHETKIYGNIQVEIVNGMILSYDKYTDIVSVMNYNWAPQYSNVELGLGKLKNESVFIRRLTSGSMGRRPRYLDAMSAMVHYLSTPNDIWNALNTHETQDYESAFIYVNSYNGQKEKYNNKVVRAISINSGSGYLTMKGEYFLLEGQIYNHTYDWRWVYRAKIRHSL